METETVLRQIVAEFFETEPGQIGPDFVLTGGRMQGSLGRARLDAAIRRRAGIRSQAAYTARSYGELEAAVLGKHVTPAPGLTSAGEIRGSLADLPVQPNHRASQSRVSCGIDIEMTENLPLTTDYWEEDFYNTHFTPAEIAYCLTKENPLVHFAARWCAKEALKKCDSAYMSEQMSSIEVASDASGAPLLRHYANGKVTTLDVAVSISHMPTAAAAMVIKLTPEPEPPRPSVEKQDSPSPESQDLDRNVSVSAPLLLAAIALGLSLWALVRTFF
jgi:holo-[acyl-carrier protein] synthase